MKIYCKRGWFYFDLTNVQVVQWQENETVDVYVSPASEMPFTLTFDSTAEAQQCFEKMLNALEQR